MRLHPRTFRLLWDVHAWLGVVLAPLLFIIFFAGAFTLFRGPLEVWSEPRLQAPLPPAARGEGLDALVGRALAGAPPADGQVWLQLPRPAWPYLRASWQEGEGRAPREVLLSAGTGERVEEPVRSSLAALLFDVHRLELVPGGELLGGVAATALLLALLAGLLVHLKDLRRHPLRLRLRERLRVALADAHTLLGVLLLPLLLLYGVTGAYLGFHNPVWRALAATTLRERPAIIEEDWSGEAPSSRAVASPAEAGRPPGVSAFVTALAAEGLAVHALELHRPEGGGGWARVFAEGEGLLRTETRTVRLEDGALLSRRSARLGSPVHLAQNLVVGLHVLSYGGVLLKALAALCALAVCAAVLLGGLLWVERRGGASRPAAAVARLLAGTCAGLVLATGGLLVASRLLPLALEGRAALERATFFVLWAAAAALPWTRVGARGGTRGLLAASVPLFLLAPLLNRALVTGPGAVPVEVAGVDAGLLLTGLVLAVAAQALRGGTQPEGALAGRVEHSLQTKEAP